MQRLWAPVLCGCRELHYTLFWEVHLLPSCLALSCLSQCPSEASSLAAPQALHPLCGCVGKGALAGPCSPPGAEVLLEQPGAIWGCSLSLSPQDDQIEQERASQHLAGGCCALAAIYLMGKFYVANAGDSRYSPTGQPSPFAQWLGTPQRHSWGGTSSSIPVQGRVEVAELGRVIPCLLHALGTTCCDLCVCLVHRQGCRIGSQSLGCAAFLPNNILSAAQRALDHTLAPAAGSGLGCSLGSENCTRQSFRKSARSHFRVPFIPVTCSRRRTQVCVQTRALGAWRPRI